MDVRGIISFFERRTKLSTTPQRSKSLIDLTRKYHGFIDGLDDQLAIFQDKLDSYRTYLREEHVRLQDELLEILWTIMREVSNEGRREELTVKIKQFFDELHRRLPANGTMSKVRGLKGAYDGGSNDGLATVIGGERPRLYSFGAGSCDLIDGVDEKKIDGKYVVDGVMLKKRRLIHNSGIQRNDGKMKIVNGDADECELKKIFVKFGVAVED